MKEPNTEVPAIVVSRGDGTVVSQNLRARSLMGVGLGRSCQSVVGSLADAKGLPCSQNCVRELLAGGLDQPRDCSVRVHGRHHHLTCIPLDDIVVSVLSSSAESTPTAWQLLTPREIDVLRLLAGGETIPSAAIKLEISNSTVRTHVEHMREKLGVNTQAALVAVGFLLGYLG